ncbi:MAG: phosphohistidine phosphatase SixA [Phormidesmis sp.]
MSVTEVYFIRHGIAESRTAGIDDEGRSLTPKGIAKTQQIAQRLSDLGLEFDRLLTSPLRRAQQTAEIMRDAGLASQMQEFLPLRPGGSLANWLTWLAQRQVTAEERSIALVGHEPDLSEWAQQLVCGQRQTHWTLKKAGIIGLQVPAADRAIGQSQLFWLSPPRFLL